MEIHINILIFIEILIDALVLRIVLNMTNLGIIADVSDDIPSLVSPYSNCEKNRVKYP